MSTGNLHLVYTDDAMHLLRVENSSWQRIQESFALYKTSLSFAAMEEAADVIKFEYPAERGWPNWRDLLTEFAACKAINCVRLSGYPGSGEHVQ